MQHEFLSFLFIFCVLVLGIILGHAWNFQEYTSLKITLEDIRKCAKLKDQEAAKEIINAANSAKLAPKTSDNKPQSNFA
jgi:hypothetical protein